MAQRSEHAVPIDTTDFEAHYGHHPAESTGRVWFFDLDTSTGPFQCLGTYAEACEAIQEDARACKATDIVLLVPPVWNASSSGLKLLEVPYEHAAPAPPAPRPDEEEDDDEEDDEGEAEEEDEEDEDEERQRIY
jgi:hypothetical protein